MLKMAFQVVELTLHADQNVVDRRAIPYPYPTRKDAVDAIESLVATSLNLGIRLILIAGGFSSETVLAVSGSP